jgi:DNA-directed RNA polymerase subunit RPC12/RpoP
MKHLFKCVECGKFFEKKGSEVVCGKCPEKQPVVENKPVVQKKKQKKKQKE